MIFTTMYSQSGSVTVVQTILAAEPSLRQNKNKKNLKSIPNLATFPVSKFCMLVQAKT